MIHSTKFLGLVLSSLTLAACGGGGGGDTSAGAPASNSTGGLSPTVPAVSIASLALAKYEGVWQQDCVDHMHRTTTLVAINANTFTVTPQENYFANADCTGSQVAVGGFDGKPQETVQYSATLPSASVLLQDGSTVQVDVDPATSTLSIASYVFSGSGVVQTLYIEGGKTLATLAYATGNVPVVRDASNGIVTQGGLALLNGELLALVSVASLMPSTPSFAVNHRFHR